jgi:carboxypeptidase Taq
MKQEKLDKLKQKLTELSYLNSANALLHWDQEVNMPRGATEARSKTSSNLSKLIHEKILSDNFSELIESTKEALDENKLNDKDAAIVREAYREYKREAKLPADFVEELTKTTSKAKEAWKEAREKRDFSIFQPHLEQIVELKREEADLVGYEGTPYNALLDVYEPYFSSEKLDSILEQLKDFLVPFLERIQNSEVSIDSEFTKQEFSVDKQKNFCSKVVKTMGFDKEQGLLDESVHPFTIGLHPTDVRLTSRFNSDELLKSITASIHEAGHALYEQGLPEKKFGTPLAEPASVGIHESQSRIWELKIGQSKEFWQHFYPKLQDIFSDKLSEFNQQDFYEAVNKVQPNPIRVGSDEVSYHLHIILRYELERALIEDKIEVKDLPELWNEKMQDYLGVEVDNISEGVLQDIHWSQGNFGYFPTYTLGSVYGSQFFHQAKQNITSLKEKIAEGKFGQFRTWLRDNIHSHGKYYKPNELVKEVTGEGLDPDYLINYLKQKYSNLYNL